MVRYKLIFYTSMGNNINNISCLMHCGGTFNNAINSTGNNVHLMRLCLIL